MGKIKDRLDPDPGNVDRQTKGLADQSERDGNVVGGRAREAYGGATGRRSDQIKGKAQEIKGKVQQAIGKAKKKSDDDTDSSSE